MLTETLQQSITPKSVVRHRPIGHNRSTTPITKRASRKQHLPHTTGGPPFAAETSMHRARAHSLVPVGLAMLTTVIFIGVLQLAWSWGITLGDDLRYGRPRTFQTDAWVGHNEQTGIPSHFIALNLNRHIEVIEIQGGDPAHTRIYSGPELFGAHDDLVPVTLRFVDVNGDHKLDMLVNFAGSRMVFINDGDSFRPLLPIERGPVEQFLQRLEQ